MALFAVQAQPTPNFFNQAILGCRSKTHTRLRTGSMRGKEEKKPLQCQAPSRRKVTRLIYVLCFVVTWFIPASNLPPAFKHPLVQRTINAPCENTGLSSKFSWASCLSETWNEFARNTKEYPESIHNLLFGFPWSPTTTHWK